MINIQSYADATPLNLQCHHRDVTTVIRRLEMFTIDVNHLGHRMAAKRLKLNADKTELLWASSKYGCVPLDGAGAPLRHGDETVTASDHARLLGVTLSSDFSLEKLVSTASSSCFY